MYQLCGFWSPDKIKYRLSRLEDFSKALYTFDIGQNDIHHALTTTTEDEARKSIPDLVYQFALAIKVTASSICVFTLLVCIAPFMYPGLYSVRLLVNEGLKSI